MREGHRAVLRAELRTFLGGEGEGAGALAGALELELTGHRVLEHEELVIGHAESGATACYLTHRCLVQEGKAELLETEVEEGGDDDGTGGHGAVGEGMREMGEWVGRTGRGGR